VSAPASSRNGLDAGERAIAGGHCRHRQHDLCRRCITWLIDAVDDVLNNLEQLHLLDRRRVPAAYAAPLERLTAVLPADVRCGLRTGIPIVRLMESLYDIQGKLMARRSGWTMDRPVAHIPGFGGDSGIIPARGPALIVR
jgi:hypothetical protein